VTVTFHVCAPVVLLHAVVLLQLRDEFITLRVRQIAAITCSLYDKMMSGKEPPKQGLVFPPTFYNLDISLFHFQAQVRVAV
jgi:hypothetical protein